MIRSICFDLGGVIVGAFGPKMLERASELFDTDRERIRQAMNHHEGPLERGEIDHVSFWTRVAEDLGVTLPAGAERLYIDPWLEHAPIDEDMLAYVASLKERFIIGCISNTQEPHVTLLTERGVLTHFEPRILSCEEGVRKPGRAIFERYCERAGTRPEEVVFVDDQPENLEAPREIGMHTVLFTGIGTLRETLSRIEHGRNPTGHP